MPILRNALYLSRRRYPRGALIHLMSACKALVVGPAWVGDAVLAQPLLAALRHNHPEEVLHVLAPPWTHGVLTRMPQVAQVLTNPFAHGQLALGQRRALGRQLAQAGYTRAMLLPNSFKSALVPWFAQIPIRTGYVGEMRGLLLNDARVLDASAYPLMVERFAALAYPATTPLPRPLPPPRLSPNLVEQRHSLNRLELNSEAPVLVLCPGAEYGPAKQWPARHFAVLAQHGIAQGHQVWIMGSAKDRAMGDAIRALAPGPIWNLCGKTRLSEAVDLMALADLVVSNDSGLMHVAAALGRPLKALFGSSSPRFTPPLSDQAHVFSLHLPCSPCFKRTCPLGHTNCLEHLLPEQLLAD